MKKGSMIWSILLCCILLVALNAGGGQAEAKDWPMFCHDPQHTGNSYARFTKLPLKRAWVFSPGGHVWNYRRMSSVWSSPAVAVVDGTPMLFAGAYDRNVYALNAENGKKIWEYTTGDGVFATPLVAKVKGEYLVFVSSSDRTVYCLDARTGKRKWGYEVLKWGYTVNPSSNSSLTIADIPARRMTGGKGQQYILGSIWVNDQSGVRNVQRGLIFALEASTGKLIWRRRLGTTIITTPAFFVIDGKPLVLVASSDGILWSLDARTGEVNWTHTREEHIFSSPAVAKVNGIPFVFFGVRFHSLHAVDARNGKWVWGYQSGHWVDSTPAVGRIGEKDFIFFGSYDRSVYCLDARTGKREWFYTTGNGAYSNPALFYVGDRLAVCVASLDNHLYILDAEKGELLQKIPTGKLLWPYMWRADSIWTSPATCEFRGKAYLYFPSWDGKIYAFTTSP